MTKPAFKPEKILWIDLEMTGLDPAADVILEVGAIVTNWQLEEVASYQGVIRHENGVLMRGLKRNAVFWDENPQARDGLIAQNRDGHMSSKIERELVGFIKQNIGDGPILLAGNSIHMDRRFIEQHWKDLEAMLHYRMLDVSAWKVVFEGRYGGKFAKPDEHRALEDIRGSIMELKYYLSKVNK